MEYKDIALSEIDQVLENAWTAFHQYRKCSLQQRATFMRTIATEIEQLGDELLRVAGEETHLPQARLRNERARTMFQLTSYADACEKGEWLDIRIDTTTSSPRPDIRKMQVPLGPVVVFGAANFPFAYSTAGGDTATALAAGCPVIVKAHPAHAHTSELVATAIRKAASLCNMPTAVFTHVHGASFEIGKALVEHPRTKAVGFTGSYTGGKQLFDWANQRKVPIPVFAEMSSVNPVFLLPGKLKESALSLAQLYAGSITLGVGQFCTNPGLLIAIDSEELNAFLTYLKQEIGTTVPATMLNTGIFKNYVEKRANALSQTGVEMIAVASTEAQFDQGAATIASTSGETFLANPLLHQEVFGPYSLVIRCSHAQEMLDVARVIEGQLTATMMATIEDMQQQQELVAAVQDICGRFILNGVPTGVEVCLSMQHGGPFPATTDSRFTAVGADGIRRFSRPVSFQNWPDELLPDELKEGNPWKISRTVNDTRKQ